MARSGKRVVIVTSRPEEARPAIQGLLDEEKAPWPPPLEVLSDLPSASTFELLGLDEAGSGD